MPPIKTQARGATILPNFVGLKFQVHNGKIYHDVTITEEMVGHKLGEFSPLVYFSDVPGKGAGILGDRCADLGGCGRTRKNFRYTQTKNK